VFSPARADFSLRQLKDPAMRTRRQSPRRLCVDGIRVTVLTLYITPDPWSWIE